MGEAGPGEAVHGDRGNDTTRRTMIAAAAAPAVAARDAAHAQGRSAADGIAEYRKVL
jgi:hypothetical protein